MTSGPLHGLRVIDLSSVVMVPWSTQILADLGADVVSVEASDGNVARRMTGGPAPQLSGIALNLLRNKRSVALDLRQQPHRAALDRLLNRADVFMTNLRPASLARAGLDPADVCRDRPRLVFCRASGYAASSERANDPAYDDVIQAASGLTDLFRRRTGEPEFVPMAVADKVAALTITYAVLAALFHRERSGRGQFIEVPMVDAMLAFNLVEHGAAAIPIPPVGSPGYGRVLSAKRRPQRTADGWISVLPYSRDDFAAIYAAVGEQRTSDPRLQTAESRLEHIDDLYAEVSAILSTRTTAEWVEVCRRDRVPFALIRDLEDIVQDLATSRHPTAGTYRLTPQPINWSSWPSLVVRHHASGIGEDNTEVLREAGLSAEEVGAIVASMP